MILSIDNSEIQSLDRDNLQGYGDFIKGALSYKSESEKNDWTAKQTYVALGNLLAVAAELEIDTCPMEGFEPEKYNEILGLNDKNLNAAVIVTAGYRSEEYQSQFALKVRKTKETLFETI